VTADRSSYETVSFFYILVISLTILFIW
jgi:hypothetical protein